MRARGVVTVVMFAAMWVVPSAQAHHAAWHADWDADGEGLEVGIGVGGGGGSGQAGSSGGGYTYVWTLDPCTPGGDPYIGDSFWVLVLDSEENVVGEFCAAPGDPAPPPPPPTAEEIVNQVPLPRCEIRVNPRERGLTGVETWLWCEEVEDVTVTAAIRGYGVTATASPQEFRWLPGDGSSYLSQHPGTEDDPSATHMYETKGDYVIAVDVAWLGTYTYEGHGISESGSLDGVTVDSDRGYRVSEARGVLQR